MVFFPFPSEKKLLDTSKFRVKNSAQRKGGTLQHILICQLRSMQRKNWVIFTVCLQGIGPKFHLKIFLIARKRS